MRIFGHGIDLVECDRIRKAWQAHGDRFTERILTGAELEYVRRYVKDVVPRVAGRFAAKEAILKVLGTGWRGQIAWRDMEILNDPNGAPRVTLTGECLSIATRMGISEILISISHTDHYATASAIGVGPSSS
jgi:holo-[acyl-carrier protein] synthase